MGFWIDNDKEKFTQTILEYWPQRRADDIGGLLSLYVRMLEMYPLSAVLAAVRELKVNEDFPRMPSIKKIRDRAEEISVRSGAPPVMSKRAQLLSDIGRISDNGTMYFLSPKGKLCRVRPTCLEVLDENRAMTGSLPLSDLKTEELQMVLDKHYLEAVDPWYAAQAPPG